MPQKERSRGRCPGCGRREKLTFDGLVREHAVKWDGTGGHCSGSGKEPTKDLNRGRITRR